MISKRILLAAVCFAVLFGAVVAYGYLEISGLRNHISDLETQIDSLEAERNSLQNNVSTLESQIDQLQDEIDRLQNELSHTNSTSFIFEWPAWSQTVVNGTLRLELTFTWNEENLSIIAKINDDEYRIWDYIGLVFFNDSEYEAYGLFADNIAYSPEGVILTKHGFLGFPMYPPEPGPHKVTFDPEEGYTFNVQFPWVDQHGKEWNPARLLKRGAPFDPGWNMLHICFHEGDTYSGVFIRFSFEIPA